MSNHANAKRMIVFFVAGNLYVVAGNLYVNKSKPNCVNLGKNLSKIKFINFYLQYLFIYLFNIYLFI